jgi:SHAQKYF class myb-like DNA-binding protein
MDDEPGFDSIQSLHKETDQASDQRAADKDGQELQPNTLQSIRSHHYSEGMMAVHHLRAQKISGRPPDIEHQKNIAADTGTDDELRPNNSVISSDCHHVSFRHLRTTQAYKLHSSQAEEPSTSSDSVDHEISSKESLKASQGSLSVMSIKDPNVENSDKVEGAKDSPSPEPQILLPFTTEEPAESSKTGKRKRASQKPKNDQTNGRWTPAEHQAFLEGLRIFGREWKKVSERIPTRTSAQIRSHAQKYFARVSREETILQDNEAITASQQTSPSVEAVLETSRSMSTSVLRNVERILADPTSAQREVENTLVQLRERYRQLQIQLEEANVARGIPSRGRSSPLVENDERHDGIPDDHLPLVRKKRSFEDLSVGQQDDLSSVSSTLSALSPSRELGSEELIALSVLGGSLPRSASHQDFQLASHAGHAVGESQMSSPKSTVRDKENDQEDTAPADDANEDSSEEDEDPSADNHQDGMVL